MPPSGPRAVINDKDRERVLYLLREHYAQGHLDLDDLSDRVAIVLASTYTDEAASAVGDLPVLTGLPTTESAGGRQARVGQRHRHAQRIEPGPGWVPTPERFRDPSTRAITRVWVDPADLSRHYIPEPQD